MQNNESKIASKRLKDDRFMKLLFFGDSLTDMYKNYDRSIDIATSYGTGFVFDIAAHLMYERPGYYQIVNQGIGGNKVTNLYERYEKDVIEENPDVVTILIGINDIWHEIATGNGTPFEEFSSIYLKMVEDMKAKLPKAKIILMEPFFTVGDATNGALDRFEEVYRYAKEVKRIAELTNVVFVPLQEDFTNIIKDGGANQILFDGIHTNPGGAHLIALKWLEVFKSLLN